MYMYIYVYVYVYVYVCIYIYICIYFSLNYKYLENQVAEITATAESCWFSVLVAFLSLGIQALGVI